MKKQLSFITMAMAILLVSATAIAGDAGNRNDDPIHYAFGLILVGIATSICGAYSESQWEKLLWISLVVLNILTGISLHIFS